MRASRRDDRHPDAADPTERRFVEPPLGALRLLAGTLALASRSALIACAAGFLLILGLWLTLEEAVTDVWIDLGLDPVSRRWLGVLAGEAAAAAVVLALSVPADRVLLARRLSRRAQTDPAGVPPAMLRREASRDPFRPLLILSWSLIGVAALVALLELALWAENDDAGASMLVLGLCVFPSGGLLLLIGAMRAARRTRWPAVLAQPRRVWSEAVISATVSAEAKRNRSFRSSREGKGPRRQRRRKPSLLVVGMSAVAAGAAIHFLGVAIRQPGRNADQIHYAEPGEIAIDVFSLLGASIVSLGLLTLLGTGLRAVIRRSSSRLRVLHAPVEGSERPVRVDVEKALVEPSSTTMLGCIAVGASVIVIGPIAAALMVASEPQHALHPSIPSIAMLLGSLIVAVAVGLAVIAVGLVTSRSYRQALRERLHPGDDPMTSTAATGRTGRSPGSRMMSW